MLFRLRKKQPLPPPPIPIARWFRNPASVERLREITEDPVFQQACAVLQAANQPTVSAIQMETDKAAASLQWLAGFNDFERALVGLTQYPETPVEQTPTEWEYLINPEDTNE